MPLHFFTLLFLPQTMKCHIHPGIGNSPGCNVRLVELSKSLSLSGPQGSHNNHSLQPTKIRYHINEGLPNLTTLVSDERGRRGRIPPIVFFQFSMTYWLI